MINKKVLIVYDYFDPAYKAGGPIRSLVNLVKLMEKEFDFFILTSNQDHDGSVLNVVSNHWIIYGKYSSVMYLSKDKMSYQSIRKIISEINPDKVYLNGIFSVSFFMYPLLSLRKHSEIKIIIAPRGMLQEGALQMKWFKKKVYLRLIKLFIPFSRIWWHATDEQEKLDIQKRIGTSNVTVIGNLAQFDQIQIRYDKPKFNFVCISLIARKKNHLTFLNALRKINYSESVQYDIYGPISDKTYFNEMLSYTKNMPQNISIEYKGEIHPNEISSILSNYQFYVLTSFGENFGHSIFEAFNAGVPVIISDQTPWKGLRDKKAGWDVDLDDGQALVKAIEETLSMDKATYLEFCKGARAIAEAYMAEHDFVKLYQELFT